ncbi:beta propeller repeat protein [Streptomyces davaonensis]|uniref:glycoside hydrolase n=1 Tax=Streptomyces davaonensis TaxID=348043 RepID=UPI0012FF7FCD|nr:glycoside hydrolase [Streptomyces davaonensis]
MRAEDADKPDAAPAPPFPPGPERRLALAHDLLQRKGFEDALTFGKWKLDTSFRWRLSALTGIARRDEAFHAGHAHDVLPLNGGAALVAAHTGGVWLVLSTGGAVCVSNLWSQPNVNCLVQGPRPDEILALGDGAYATHWGHLFARLAWLPITMPPGVARIHAAEYMPGADIVVVAANQDVFWSPWPATPLGPWAWTPVGLPGDFQGLALGPNQTICAAARGGAISVLAFTAAGGLQLAATATVNGIVPTDMRTTILTSSPADRNRMYAATSRTAGRDEWLLAVLRSNDGGRTWNACANTLTGDPGRDLLQSAGNQGGWNNALAASPVNADVALLGWRKAGIYLTEDGGQTWTLRANDDPGSNAHLHSDVHAMRFDTEQADGRRYLVASDGGVVTTDDLGGTYTSLFNSRLPTLQFGSNPPRSNQEGSGSSFAARPDGVIAGGLQDNGVVWKRAGRYEPWHHAAESDGHRAVFLSTGDLLLTTNVAPAPQLCIWSAQGWGSFGPPRTVLRYTAAPGAAGRAEDGVRDLRPGDPPPGGFRHTPMSAVHSPSFHRTSTWSLPGPVGGAPGPTYRRLMLAVAAIHADVYGLFAGLDPSRPLWAWEYLGTVSQLDAASQYITAVASFDGHTVYAGTSDARIFAVDSKNGTSIDLPVTPVASPAFGGHISQLIQYGSGQDAYAIRGSDLLRLDGLKWQPVRNLPVEQLFAVEVNRAGDVTEVFAATDSKVFVSRDAGDTWKLATAGLPQRAHCTGLAIGADENGDRVLYLSTYGRSVWDTLIRSVPAAPGTQLPGDARPQAEMATGLRVMSARLAGAARREEATAAGLESARITADLITDPQQLDPASVKNEARATAHHLIEVVGAWPGAESITATQTGVALYRGLLADQPDDREARNMVAWGLSDRLAVRQSQAGNNDAAAAAAREAIEITLALTTDPGSLSVPDLARRVVEVAGYLPIAEAVTSTRKGVEVFRGLLAPHPDDKELRNLLAWALSDRLVVRQNQAGDTESAAAGAREAIEITQALTTNPGSLSVSDLARRVVLVAGYLPAAEAVTATRSGIEVLRQLVTERPDDRDRRNLLAWALTLLAQREAATGATPD